MKGEQLKAYYKHPFFHNVCLNKNVTLEIVQFILEVCPDVVKQGTVLRGGTAHPLHCVCKNDNCDHSVVKFILEGYPKALEVSCLVDNGPDHGLGKFDFLVKESN